MPVRGEKSPKLKLSIIPYYSLLTQGHQDSRAALIGLYPCPEFTQLPWTYWNINPLILLPQSHWIAKDLQLNINSRVYVLSHTLHLTELYKLNPWDRHLHQQSVGFINTTIDLKGIDNIWERRKNLSGIHLNVIFLDQSPYAYVDRTKSNITGYFGELFLLLHEYLQFEYTLTQQGDKIYGNMQSDGTYNGIMGKIHSGQSNWSITQFLFTLTRNQARKCNSIECAHDNILDLQKY